ncbi:MAG: prephenate/arogenate dehydrogenase family protein, partial [Methylocystis sp.]|nr:prephenate/arogenate dehydrogenase family protein [Methylocystis sp.]
MPDPVFDKIALIGAGLIGSSIARAAREYGVVRKIAVADCSADVIARVEAIGFADVASVDCAA